jgi:hypothetical protein
LPAALDHSTEPYMPAVGDQIISGACSSFSAAYYVNGYQQARDLGWQNASKNARTEQMSPAWVYNMINNGKNGGADSWTNAQLMKNIGNARWVMMPYNPGQLTAWGNESAWRDAPTYRCGNIYSIHDPLNDTAIDAIKNALNTNHLVTFGLNAYMYAAGLGNGDDTVSSGEYKTTSVNHANTIVGYDDSKGESGETGSFKCVNSHGTSFGSAWGGNGYWWITYEAFKTLPYPVLWFDDLPKYSPSLLGVWHLNPAGSKNDTVNIGMGPYTSPVETKSAGWLAGNAQNFPDFLCMDITELHHNLGSTANEFFLQMGNNKTTSTISSFKIEVYKGCYSPGKPSDVSGESPDVPKNTPCYVTVTFDNPYAPEFSQLTVVLPLFGLILIAVIAKRDNSAKNSIEKRR